MDLNSFWIILQKVLTNASILALIIVASVQVLKTILNKIGVSKLKTKHKSLYTFIYTMLTFIAICGGVYIDLVYYLGFAINFQNIEFLVTSISLLISTIACVFFVYNGVYEGVGIKSLVNFIWKKIKLIATSHPTSAFARFINALSNEKILNLIEDLPEDDKELDEMIENTKDEVKEAVKDIKEEAKSQLKVF